jgi:hypothetical protein
MEIDEARGAIFKVEHEIQQRGPMLWMKSFEMYWKVEYIIEKTDFETLCETGPPYAPVF